jgi:hypothetical protein
LDGSGGASGSRIQDSSLLRGVAGERRRGFGKDEGVEVPAPLDGSIVTELAGLRRVVFRQDGSKVALLVQGADNLHVHPIGGRGVIDTVENRVGVNGRRAQPAQ